MIYPNDRSPVLFKDKEGVTREGVYMLAQKAFVESVGDEGPEDAGNLYPQANIVAWEYLERPETDEKLDTGFQH